jgi:hypothetical protein
MLLVNWKSWTSSWEAKMKLHDLFEMTEEQMAMYKPGTLGKEVLEQVG